MVQEGPREYLRVQEGPGGSRRVREGPGGFRRVQNGLDRSERVHKGLGEYKFWSFWEIPGEFKRFWMGLGSRLVRVGPGGSQRVW